MSTSNPVSEISSRTRSRIIIAASIAGILCLPLIAMQFSDQVNWDGADFLIFGLMLLIAGVTFDFVRHQSDHATYKKGMVLAILATFLLFWINGAVGIIGSEDNSANLMFFVIVLVAVLGSLISGFAAYKMKWVMYVAAASQVIVFLVAWIAGWGFTGPITLVFTALWLGAAKCFEKASAVSIQVIEKNQ